MRYSLRFLVLLVTASAVVTWALLPEPCPIRTLSNSGAIVTGGYSILDEICDSVDGISPPIATDVDLVDRVRFSRSNPPSIHEIQLLSSFPNLAEVYFPCTIEPNDLSELKKCNKLRLVSFRDSDAGDDVIDYVLAIPSVCLVYTYNSNITQLGNQRLKKHVTVNGNFTE